MSSNLPPPPFKTKFSNSEGFVQNLWINFFIKLYERVGGQISMTNDELEGLTGGADADAIHDNVSGEISAITTKSTPVSGDILLIEDSASGYAKKKISIGSLPATTDANAIHDNVAGEISSLTPKATPVSGDYLIIEDSEDSDNKKYITIGDLPSSGAFSWIDLATNWDSSPTLNESIAGGDVYNYTLDGITRYRFVPSTYLASQDAFYESYNSGTNTLSDLIVQRGY